MVTELLFPGFIIVLVILGLGLLLMGARSEKDVTEKPPNEDRRVPWYKDCYEPCIRERGQNADLCVAKCSWNSP